MAPRFGRCRPLDAEVVHCHTLALMARTSTSSPRIIAADSREDVLPDYRGTPIEAMLVSHNLKEVVDPPAAPELLIATCMDPRIDLHLPKQFAFVIRTAGANVDALMFNIAGAVALAPVRSIAIMGHSDCAMARIDQCRREFAATVGACSSLSDDEVAAMYTTGLDAFGFDDPAAQTLRQADALRRLFPQLLIAPLYYDVEDHRIYQLASTS